MSIVWTVRQTASARADRATIIRWTATRFGVRQAAIYAETIALALAALEAGPDTPGARRRDDLPGNALTLHVARQGRKGRHFIVFRIGGKHVIDVLRILYDGMDLARHVD
ncbi:MAG: type II toxin-antitoxin system RelE/ParE family toxin [Alcanivorax sp.]|nr:type II toxin-antitoxin system RelE/ParE family toxin [Alcanivorax sp.]